MHAGKIDKDGASRAAVKKEGCGQPSPYRSRFPARTTSTTSRRGSSARFRRPPRVLCPRQRRVPVLDAQVRDGAEIGDPASTRSCNQTWTRTTTSSFAALRAALMEHSRPGAPARRTLELGRRRRTSAWTGTDEAVRGVFRVEESLDEGPFKPFKHVTAGQFVDKVREGLPPAKGARKSDA